MLIAGPIPGGGGTAVGNIVAGYGGEVTALERKDLDVTGSHSALRVEFIMPGFDRVAEPCWPICV